MVEQALEDKAALSDPKAKRGGASTEQNKSIKDETKI